MEAIREANHDLRTWGTYYKEKYEEIEDIENEMEGAKETIADLQIEVRDLESENYILNKKVEKLQMEVDSWEEYNRNCQE